MSGFDHFFQIADAAFVAVFVLFGSFVLKVFAEIALGTGFFYSLELFWTDNQFAVVDFFLLFFNIVFGQFIIHDFSTSFLVRLF